MKAKIKLIRPVFGSLKEGDIVACKQFQSKFRAYKVGKKWSGEFYDLQAVAPSRFFTYDEILSVPISEIYQISCEADMFASGSYSNICSKCKKEFQDADKLWFLCPEHSIQDIALGSDHYGNILETVVNTDHPDMLIDIDVVLSLQDGAVYTSAKGWNMADPIKERFAIPIV